MSTTFTLKANILFPVCISLFFFFTSSAEAQQIVTNHLQHVSVFIGNYRQSLHSASHQNNHMNGWISCNHANYMQLDCIK